MPRLRTLLGLTLLAATALVVRVAMVVSVAAATPRAVTYEHGEIAENLLAGRGFSVKFLGVDGPTSQQAPLYPVLLAACYRLFGVGSTQSLLAMQGLQCVAGTGLVLAVAWLAWSLVPSRPTTGWVAGWGAALYPTHIYMVTHIQVALWAALCLTLLVALVASPGSGNSWRKAALAGLLAGVLLLIEPILVLALPFVAWMFWLNNLPQKASGGRQPGDSGLGARSLSLWERAGARAASRSTHASAHLPSARPNSAPPHPNPLPKGEGTRSSFAARLGRQALLAGVAALVIAPWVWRNYLVHGEPVFIKSTFGYAFWQGNNPASWGTDKIPKRSAEALRTGHDGSIAGMHRALWEARHETLYIDDVLLAPGGYREFAGLSEPERSRLLFDRACDFVRHEPARYLRLCARRLRYFLLFDETNPKAAPRVYRMATVAWLVLAFTGSLALRSHWRRLWPCWAIFVVVTLFHALTIVSARFRIPLEPISFVWAAGAIAPLVDRLVLSPWASVFQHTANGNEEPSLPHPVLRGPHRRPQPSRRRSPAPSRSGRGLG